jgi:hypothetical protein
MSKEQKTNGMNADDNPVFMQTEHKAIPNAVIISNLNIEIFLDTAYNTAIDHAIEVMRQWYRERNDSTFEYYFREQIKPRLNNLKK